MAKIKSLKQNLLFKDLSNREIAVFSQIVDEVSLAQGESVSSENHGFILIKKGAIQVSYQSNGIGSKNDFTLHLGPGEFFGELSVLSGSRISGDRLPFKLLSREPSEILQILPQRFYSLAEKEPQICFKVIQSISQYFGNRLLKHQKIIAKLLRG